jgi:RHS repeat-associated protein
MEQLVLRALYVTVVSLLLVVAPREAGAETGSNSALVAPSGQGSVRGLGESYSASLSSGMVGYAVPIVTPPGRAGVAPKLVLSYSSAAGNGTAGIGWSLEVPAITRQTERGVPRYLDQARWHAQEDRFIYVGGRELVPVSDAAALAYDGVGSPGGLSGYQQYRAQVSPEALRVYRAPDFSRWIIQAPDGWRFEFGALPSGSGPNESVVASNAARQTGPNGEVFRWLLTRACDAHGSCIYYRYTADGGERYLSDVDYVSPSSCGASSPQATAACTAPLSEYAAHVRFVYELRPDAVSSYSAGFLVRTSARLKRVEVTSAGDSAGRRALVRRYHLRYHPSSYHSFLSELEVEGRPETVDAETASALATPVPESALGNARVGVTHPPLRFRYTGDEGLSSAGLPALSDIVRSAARSPNVSAGSPGVELFDINADGLLDVIDTDVTRYRAPDGGPAAGVFYNGFSGAGAGVGTAGSFSEAQALPVPSGTPTSRISLTTPTTLLSDVTGDGLVEILSLPKSSSYGYFTATFDPTRPAATPAQQGLRLFYVPVTLPPELSDPRIDLATDRARIRTFDANGDGLVDIVRATGSALQTWMNLGNFPGGDGRYGTWTSASDLSTAPIETCLPRAGSAIDFRDATLQTADMNGDGLEDLVRVAESRVVYWPSRGSGRFGIGDGPCPPGVVDGQHVTLALPSAGIVTSGVLLSDIDADGLADLVRPIQGALSVWLNRSGEALADRIQLSGLPSVSDAAQVRLVDIDGSGTKDVVFASARQYKWVDPLGGKRPRLLRAVDNGLGALTEIEYGASTEDYLRDLAAGVDRVGERFLWRPASTGCDELVLARTGQCVHSVPANPLVTTVVRAHTTSDRFDRLGREASVKRTQYAYHDPYYDGFEREARGFRVADAHSIGDPSHPSSTQRSYFHQGVRPSELGLDRKAANPNQALAAQEFRTDTFDDAGRTLATVQRSFTIRKLLVGLDGRRVDLAFPARTDRVVYDLSAETAPRTLGPLATSGFVGVLREELDPSNQSEREDADWPRVPQPLPLRHPRYAHVLATLDELDRFGQVRRTTAYGRVHGEDGEPLPDERITTHSEYQVIGGSAWMLRRSRSWIDGHGTTTPLNDVETRYDARTGDATLDTTRVTLPRAFAFAGDANGASAYTQTAEPLRQSMRYDVWGNVVARCEGADLSAGSAGCLRLQERVYDAAYGALTLAESVVLGRKESTAKRLTTRAEWDRGLGVIVSVVEPSGGLTRAGYDGLGRISFVRSPPVQGCEGKRVPTTRLRYALPNNPGTVPVSFVESIADQSCAALGADVVVTRSYFDGLGRARAALIRSEGPHAWQRSGVQVLDAKGSDQIRFQPDFLELLVPTPSQALTLPEVPFDELSHDAFGRTLCVQTPDGARTCTTHRALSEDACDPLDNDASSPFFGTCTTTRRDGHGRTIDTVRRARRPGVPDEYHRLFKTYRADGSVVEVSRARSVDAAPRGVTAVVDGDGTARTFTRDSIGRLLASTDPDTDARRAESTPANRTFRYLYNRVGDLVASRDPRGCGKNSFYDDAGRNVGAQYVGCAEAQPHEGKPETLPAGAIALERSNEPVTVDERTYFDEYPPWATGALAPPDGEEQAIGRATASVNRAERSVASYDARGHVVRSAKQLAVLPDSTGILAELAQAVPVVDPTEGRVARSSVVFDTEHTYVRVARFDHGGRPRGLELSPDPDAGPDAPRLTGSLEFNPRGLPARSSLQIGDLPPSSVAQASYTRDGLVESIVYGEARPGQAATQTFVEYDSRRRPTRSRTTREPTGAASDSRPLSAVTVPSDQRLSWDAAGNLTTVDDLRLPNEWRAGYRPQSAVVQRDSLYRVTSVDYTYQHASGEPSTRDESVNFREALAELEAVDPMATRAAPRVAQTPDQRVARLGWDYDWLGNVTRWDDDARVFHERSLGRLTNGLAQAGDRPSALQLASNLPSSQPPLAAQLDRGGYAEVDTGDGGFVTAVTVHGQCSDTARACYDDVRRNLAERRSQLRSRCQCKLEQHYAYRWDELGRLSDARRYDRSDGKWRIAARVRYRYDATGARAIKALHVDEDERVALTIFDGELERRGLSRGGARYDATPLTETQYLIGGARVVWRPGNSSGGLDAKHRATLPLGDLIGTTSAVIDLPSGELVEVGSYAPNGARETLLTSGAPIPSEPLGFTGKEADAEVGVTYFGARYLLPHLGRWASADPLQVHEAGGGEPLNNYHYVAGNMLQSFDPIGLEPPPKRLPPEKAMIGIWMHQLIGGMIGAASFGHLQFHDQRLDRIVSAYGLTLPKALEPWARLRPDLGDAGLLGAGRATNRIQIAEYKPVGSEALAREEAEAYAWALRQSGISATLRPSHAPGMQGSLNFALFSLRWSSPMDGVVTYSASFRLPFPQFYRQRVRERLPEPHKLNRDWSPETPPIPIPPIVVPGPAPAAPPLPTPAPAPTPWYLRLLRAPVILLIVPENAFRDFNHEPQSS